MQKVVLASLIICLSSFISSGFPNRNLDSLEVAIEVMTPREKIPVLNALASSYASINPNKSRSLALEALDLSHKFDDRFQKAAAYYNLGESKRYLNSVDEAISSYNKALDIYTNLNATDGIGLSHKRLGQCYLAGGRFDLALKHFENAYEHFKSVKNHAQIAATLNNIGIVQQKLGNQEIALDYYLNALKIKEKTSSTASIAATKNNIGLLYLELNDVNKALTVFYEALVLAKKSADLNGIALCYSNIGASHLQLENFDSAQVNFYNAFLSEKESGNQIGMGSTLNNLGYTSFQMAAYQKAIEYYKEAIKYKKRSNNKADLAGTYNNLGSAYLAINDLPNAELFSKQALVLSLNAKSKQESLAAYEILSKSSEKKGLLSDALAYQKKCFAIQSEISSEHNTQLLNNLEMKNQTASRSRDVELSKKERSLQLVRQNAMITALGLAFILLLVIIFFVYKKHRMNQTMNEKLREQNAEINHMNLELNTINLESLAMQAELLKIKQDLEEKVNERTEDLVRINRSLKSEISERLKVEKELEQKAIAITIANKDLLQFAYVTSHDLREPIRMVNNYVQLLQKKYIDQLDEQAEDYIQFALDGARRIHELVKDLQRYVSIGEQSGIKEVVDIKDLLDQVQLKLGQSYRDQVFEIVLKDLQPVYAIKSQMHELIYNLVENAIKFCSTSKAIIEIGTKVNENNRIYYIKDNGIGIDEIYSDKVFNMFQRLHARNGYRGSGIGLSICKKIVESHGGKIWYRLNEDSGTTFYFTMPGELQHEKTG